MSGAWRVMAQNYARYDTPLRPNQETLEAIRRLPSVKDPLVVVLGGTPIFTGLARRVWFIDFAEPALELVPEAPERRRIQKDWLAASAEIEQADLIVGDGSLNSLESPEAAAQLLRSLAANRKPGAALALRVYIKHELGAEALAERLDQAFSLNRFSEVRFLVYGVLADAAGVVRVAEIDRYIDRLDAHLGVDRSRCEAYKAAYFEWRGLSAESAARISAKAFIPSRGQIEGLFASAGLAVSTIGAGRFPLAEYTPIYTSPAGG